MDMTFGEIRHVMTLLETKSEMFDDEQAEAMAKLILLAGQETSRRLFGNGREWLLPAEENVFGIMLCDKCGKYLRHSCERKNIPAPVTTVKAAKEESFINDTSLPILKAGDYLTAMLKRKPIETVRKMLQELNPHVKINILISDNGRPILVPEIPEPDLYEPKAQPCLGCGIKCEPWELISKDDGRYCLYCAQFKIRDENGENKKAPV